jgi:1-acyl-sn-glycerol-3-phosphate acyltransferase
MADAMSPTLRRHERRIRSKILGVPFVVTNLLTRHEVFGRENLLQAIERHRSRGTGLITISNHQSLFDDPMVLAALLGLTDLNVETKAWWSTPCQSNFAPEDNSLTSRCVRYFSDISNMVFFARAEKHSRIDLPRHYLTALAERGRMDLVGRIQSRADAMQLSGESFLRRFLTEGGSEEHLAPLNQLGMVEACARIVLGDWLHFFPEGGRSRVLGLRPPRRGVGKVIYHCDEAEVLPFCFCGMHDVLPINSFMLRPLQRVVVFIGEAIPASRFAALRQGPGTPERYHEVATAAWESVQSLWPLALARYDRQRLVTPPRHVLSHTVNDRREMPPIDAGRLPQPRPGLTLSEAATTYPQATQEHWREAGA